MGLVVLCWNLKLLFAELLTPLWGDKGKGKMPIPAEDVVQPTQPSQGLLIDTVNKAPEQISARAEDDDINCFSLFLPPFPWGESQQTPQSNGHGQSHHTMKSPRLQ